MTVGNASAAAETAARTRQAQQALDQVLSLVATAERLLDEGQGVNVSRLDRRVAEVCETIAALPRADALTFATGLNRLLAGLDRLEAATRRTHALMMETLAPPEETGGTVPVGPRASAAYRRTLEASPEAPPPASEGPADDR